MTTAPVSLPFAGRLRTYASFVRFEHTLFSLPLMIAGIFSQPGPALPWTRWALIAIAAVAARTLALALNRVIDRRLDALNPRTRVRELPSGRMKIGEAAALMVVSALVYLGACALLGRWYLEVAIVPIAVFVIYPYLKRVTPLCHFGVGAALALAPLAGYAGAHPDLAHPGVAIWLAGFALAWVSGFDIIYATLDEDFDRSHGVRSMVASLGRARALAVSAALHAIAFACLIAADVWLWRVAPPARSWAAPGSALTIGAAGVLLGLEQRWAENVNLAFFKVNIFVGFAVLLMVLVTRGAQGF